MSIRIDRHLTLAGYFESREKARVAIENGFVTINGQIIRKPSFLVTDADEVLVANEGLPYVSRGGLKLEKAIRAFQLDFKDKIVLDIGASTGGFTDCALQHGAAKVFAIDVGINQLHPSLRSHPQVIWWENLHIRELKPIMLGEPVDIIVVDVSFISLRQVFPLLLSFLKPQGLVVTLIKPQFELETKIRLKKGIIKSEALRRQALDAVSAIAQKEGFELRGIIPTDADETRQNIEYLAHWIQKINAAAVGTPPTPPAPAPDTDQNR